MCSMRRRSQFAQVAMRFCPKEHRDWPHEDVQREFGALILYVMRQADRLGVDLVSAGESHISGRAGTV
jgi:hypothetical protein